MSRIFSYLCCSPILGKLRGARFKAVLWVWTLNHKLRMCKNTTFLYFFSQGRSQYKSTTFHTEEKLISVLTPTYPLNTPTQLPSNYKTHFSQSTKIINWHWSDYCVQWKEGKCQEHEDKLLFSNINHSRMESFNTNEREQIFFLKHSV